MSFTGGNEGPREGGKPHKIWTKGGLKDVGRCNLEGRNEKIVGQGPSKSWERFFNWSSSTIRSVDIKVGLLEKVYWKWD